MVTVIEQGARGVSRLIVVYEFSQRTISAINHTAGRLSFNSLAVKLEQADVSHDTIV